MRALIASDLHGSLSSLRFLINKAKEMQPDLLILLGDLVYHGHRNPLPQSYDTMGVINDMPDLTHIPCPITAIRGNCDADVDLFVLPFAMPEDAWILLDDLRIFAIHGHQIPDNPPFNGIPKGSVVLRGHTHIPRGETIDGIHIWNPGSLSLPKGGSPRSYGVLEDGIFRVLDMEGNEVLRHQPH